MDIATGVSMLVEQLGEVTLPFLLAVTAVGTLTMAILQAAKDLFPLQREFHQRLVRQWLAGLYLTDVAAPPPRGLDAAVRDLEVLAATGDRQALYTQPTEQMCGLINSAAEMVLDYAREHEPLLRCMAAGGHGADVDHLLAAAPPRDDQAQMQGFLDARNRVGHQIQRSIDALQLQISSRWKRGLKMWSFAINAALILLASLLYGGTSESMAQPMVTHPFTAIVAVVLAALAGGFVAPVSRDLIAAIERVRGS